MDENIAQFVGSIPDFYERGMGPVIFADFAADMAQRVAGDRKVAQEAMTRK